MSVVFLQESSTALFSLEMSNTVLHSGNRGTGRHNAPHNIDHQTFPVITGAVTCLFGTSDYEATQAVCACDIQHRQAGQ